ncbi:MAG: outer membrane beta-barrel protein, partial [Coxiellaceae bacterium]|nr:outer membrane beta-barrel protein [Coxiellaceae bacterium]
MKKLITTIVASLGVLAAGIAFAGGPAAMMPPPASPFPEWYVGAGPSWNSIFNVESVESTGGGGGSLDIGTGWHALFGINVNDNFGAEAQYTAQGDVSGFNDVNDPERFSSWVASVSGVYRHTIYSALYFVAKLGAGYMNLEAHTFRNNNNGVNVTQDTKVHLGVL